MSGVRRGALVPRSTEPKRVSAALAERTGFDRFHIKIGLLCYQLVAGAADIDDADAGIFGEGAAEAGDEDLEAAGVEEVIVAPQVEEEVLHGNDFAAGPAETAEDFCFTVGEVDGLAFREVFQRLG